MEHRTANYHPWYSPTWWWTFRGYADMLEKQSLPITFNSVSAQAHTTSRNTDLFTAIVRHVSKANNIFISFYSNFGYKGGSQEVLKHHNLLYHPFSWKSGTWKYWFILSVGYWQYRHTQNANDEVSDSYKHLQETRNKHFKSNLISIGTNSFSAGFNLKKLNSANYMGPNLKNNSNIVVRVKPVHGTHLFTTDNGTGTGLLPEKMYIVIEHECILEIKAQSVIFFDQKR